MIQLHEDQCLPGRRGAAGRAALLRVAGTISVGRCKTEKLTVLISRRTDKFDVVNVKTAYTRGGSQYPRW